jgi:hypothetical protein
MDWIEQSNKHRDRVYSAVTELGNATFKAGVAAGIRAIEVSLGMLGWQSDHKNQRIKRESIEAAIVDSKRRYHIED